MRNAALSLFVLGLASALCGDAPAADRRGAFADLPGVRETPAAGGMPGELLRDLADGRLDSRSLVAAALVAEGVENEAEVARLLHDWDERRATIVAAARAEETPAAMAEVALERLYADVLTGDYEAACSQSRRALDEGVYNCVSATVLYLDLCAALDLPAQPLGRPGHVCCRVRIDAASAAEWQTVETTCAAWFARAQAGKLPPHLEVERSADASNELSPLTTVQLLAKVYYNRAGNHLAHKEYAAALPWIEVAWRLDPADRRAKENLLATLNNGAIALSARGDHAAALAWIGRAREIDATFAPLSANEIYIRRAAGH